MKKDHADYYKEVVPLIPDGGTAIEVGSFIGGSTITFLKTAYESRKQINFYAVDTFCGSHGNDLIDDKILYNRIGRQIGRDFFDIFLNNIVRSKLAHLVKPLRMTSQNASSLFLDNSVDFVYLDAGHDYNSMSLDLQCWFPKVRGGGIIAGHDYPDWEGVHKAVDEFFTKIETRPDWTIWIHEKKSLKLL